MLKCTAEVPKVWRAPEYKKLEGGFVLEGEKITIPHQDMKAIIWNQVKCEEIRRGLVNLIDDSTTIGD